VKFSPPRDRGARKQQILFLWHQAATPDFGVESDECYREWLLKKGTKAVILTNFSVFD